MYLKIKFIMNLQKRKQAFTLVELIVVITILAILWTIGFVSLQGYSRDSRNTVRLSDSKLINKALWIYITTNSKYPDPEWLLNVTYSGATLWKQWTFGWGPYRKLWSLSNIPVDPLLKVEYDYSVMSNWTKFQLWTIMEWWLFSYNNDNNILNSTVAISSNDVVSYISWDFSYKDIFISTWSTCYNIVSPSLIINNIWANWVLSLLSEYKFVYNWWVNIPNSYLWYIDIDAIWSNFEISEVYNKCSIDSLTDLNTYVTNLTKAYQQFDWIDEYEDIIYNSDTVSFQLSSILKLKDDWLIIADNLITDLKAIAPDFEFIDSFSWSITDLWSWETWKYTIISDTLNKVDNTTSAIIFPKLFTPITTQKFEISFKVINTTGYTNIYANYINSDNYYQLKLTYDWYEINQNVWWFISNLTNIALTPNLSTNDEINFNVSNNVIKFLINGIEKDRVVATATWTLWNIWIEMETWWNRIDDFKLYYR